MAVTVLMVAGVAGCATRASVQEIQVDVGKVRAEVTEVRLAQELVSADLARVLAELRSLDARAGETQQTLRDAASEVVRLRTRVQATEDELRQGRPAPTSLPPTSVTPAPVTATPMIAAPPVPVPRTAVTPLSPTTGSETTRTPRDETPEQAFSAALKTFRRREHGQAVLEFMDFVGKYPKHGLAPRAQYWVGEGYYVQRDYRQALLEFKRVLEMEPGALATTDALLRIGLCHAYLRQPAPATAAWQRIVRDYPRSEAAGKARSLLSAAASSR